VEWTKGTSATDFIWDSTGVVAATGDKVVGVSQDVHGSALIDTDTTEVAKGVSYDPWGQPFTDPAVPITQELLGPSADPTRQDARLGYRGELVLDGLVHLRARDHAPTVARFTTEDPLDGTAGEPAATNPYPYAANDPLNKLDPRGLSAVDDDEVREPTRSLHGNKYKVPLGIFQVIRYYTAQGLAIGPPWYSVPLRWGQHFDKGTRPKGEPYGNFGFVHIARAHPEVGYSLGYYASETLLNPDGIYPSENLRLQYIKCFEFGGEPFSFTVWVRLQNNTPDGDILGIATAYWMRY
jgi:RHS repeat-associated protein